MEPYFESDHVTLYCGDYVKVLQTVFRASTFAAVITDPPYGTTNLKWDKKIDLREFWFNMYEVARATAPMVCFSSGKFTNTLINSNPHHFLYELIWYKNNPVGFLDANKRPLRVHENILIFGKSRNAGRYNPQMEKGEHKAEHRRSGMDSISGRPLTTTPASNKYHPTSVLEFDTLPRSELAHATQKPVELMEWLVRSYSNPRNLILDPFAGSGSTLIAAARAGRKAVGIEKSREICRTAAKRLKAEGL